MVAEAWTVVAVAAAGAAATTDWGGERARWAERDAKKKETRCLEGLM